MEYIFINPDLYVLFVLKIPNTRLFVLIFYKIWHSQLMENFDIPHFEHLLFPEKWSESDGREWCQDLETLLVVLLGIL